MEVVCNKPIVISEEIKKRLESTVGKKPLEIAYYNGNLMKIKGMNIDYINPAKVIIKLYTRNWLCKELSKKTVSNS